MAVPRTGLQRALADNGGGQVAGGRWLRGVAGRCDRRGNSPVIALSAAAGDSSRKKDSAAVQVGADVTAVLTHPGVFIPPRSFIQSDPRRRRHSFPSNVRHLPPLSPDLTVTLT